MSLYYVYGIFQYHTSSLLLYSLLIYVLYTIIALVIGIFQSPNSAATMLSVQTNQRGVAAAISILILSISMMLGIVITFSLVLHALSSTQLFALFIYGANNDPTFPINKVNTALAIDYYILIACAGLTSLIAIYLPEVCPYYCYSTLYTCIHVYSYMTLCQLSYLPYILLFILCCILYYVHTKTDKYYTMCTIYSM